MANCSSLWLRRAGRLSCILGVAVWLGGCAGAGASVEAGERGSGGSGSGSQSAEVEIDSTAFKSWRETLRRDALARGISERTFDQAFAGIQPIPRVIELDRRQPEFTLTFWRYFGNAVTEERVERGRELLDEHRDLLTQVEARYGVQPRYLVAFWGLETNFGDTFGSYPVIGALATLAHDERRSDFFREELLTALEILDAGDIEPARMEGSWAGAMGHLQFMPSTFSAYAVDASGDGRRDIWGSLPDVFASAANFLSEVGWRGDQDWGQEVTLPNDFDYALASIETHPETWKTMSEWSRLGIQPAGRQGSLQGGQEAALILPAGHDGPAFLVKHNYHRILRWNRSIFYAIAVGHLADRIAGKGPLAVEASGEDQRLSNAEVEELQRLLARLGHDVGSVDGELGPRTRNAIRVFQRKNNLPEDAFADPALLAQLRRAAGS